MTSTTRYPVTTRRLPEFRLSIRNPQSEIRNSKLLGDVSLPCVNLEFVRFAVVIDVGGHVRTDLSELGVFLRIRRHVAQAVLVAELVGDVLEDRWKLRHKTREVGLPAGIVREGAQSVIRHQKLQVSFGADVSRGIGANAKVLPETDGVDAGARSLAFLERLVVGVLAESIQSGADQQYRNFTLEFLHPVQGVDQRIR